MYPDSDGDGISAFLVQLGSASCLRTRTRASVTDSQAHVILECVYIHAVSGQKVAEGKDEHDLIGGNDFWVWVIYISLPRYLGQV